MFKQEAVFFSLKNIFMTVHHHAFSCLIEKEEMKMEEVCVQYGGPRQCSCEVYKAKPLQIND